MKRWASRAPIALALLTQSTPWRAAADDIYVPTDFPTISGALAVATTGDIVHLAPGDYTESWLTVGPGVELQGAGAFRTRIHAIAPTATILTVSSGSEVRAIGFDGGDVGIDGTSLVHSLTVAGCVFKEFNTGIVLGNDPSVGSAVQFLIKGNVFEVCEVGVDASFLEGSDLKLARNVMFWVDTGMYLAIEDYAIDSGIKMFNNVMINVLDFGVFIDIDGLEPVEPSLEAHHNVFASYTDGLVITCSAEGAGTLVAWNDIAHEGTGDAVFYDNSNGDCLAVTDLDFVGTFNGGNLAGVPLPGMITADAAPFLALDVNANDYLEIDLRLVLNSPYVDFGTDAALGMDPDGSDPDLGAYGGSEASNWDYDHDLASLADGDCDDFNDAVYPGAVEDCDGFDNDCDGVVPGMELDQDGDGFRGCDGDCDDNSADVYPGAAEVCDGHPDNDCDGLMDPTDDDGDGDGYSLCLGDCDPGNPAINPGAAEIPCDGVDNDCSPGTGDDPDMDGDTYTVCFGDCDDSSPAEFSCRCTAGARTSAASAPGLALLLSALGLAVRRRSHR